VRKLTISNFEISDSSQAFVIAEIGHNHQGNLETAKKMIRSAKEAGASAVKLQKRSNKSLFTTAFFNRTYNGENSFGRTYGEHREKLEFNQQQYLELKQYSKELGVIFFATAFDCESVDFLVEIGVPALKVASGDLTNIPLLRYMAETRLPLIISTGGASLGDVSRVVDELQNLNVQFSLLQCTAGYPPKWEEINLRVISTFKSMFPGTVVGFSSHDNGIAMAAAAYALGARIVEKHFTLDRTMRGTDHAFSLEPQGFKKMIRDLNRLHLALGDGVKKPYESEAGPLEKMSKKIVLSRSLEAHHLLDVSCFDFKSPGDGLKPWQANELIGKRLKYAMEVETAVSLDDVY
jgi:sialic acid synthase